jgi:hypothetical protein
MKLIHYSNSEFELEKLTYDQSKMSWNAKPNGLWVSVQGEYDWKWWCEEENFELENLAISYEVKLKEAANILHLKTTKEVLNFAKIYPFIKPQWDNPEGRKICANYEIDWHKVKERYQGIIIAPYQRPSRLHQDSNWYYAWDCASGCIWDIDCIEEFNLRESEVCPNESVLLNI